ncbi:MAG: uracil-DNA glycosylase [Candidatus Dormibacteraeota bacterium]|nr:uracil-DNA glycosylase [Candidatus Dormibacteraeota bacterium]
MRPIFGFSSCAARARMFNALAALLVASHESGPPGSPDLSPMIPVSSLDELHATIRACKNCGLHATRTQAVPGIGPCPAHIMIVGEAPGFNEDRQGEPFVGAAGKLLDTLLARIGLSRADVYITNVLKCRPPMNRDPMPNEAEACSPYLKRQLELVQPKVVLILGRHALERLMPGQGSISRIHGSLVKRGDVAYVPLYHPAAALHNGSLVADLEHDFDRVKAYLDKLLAPPPPPAPVEPPQQEAEQLRLL